MASATFVNAASRSFTPMNQKGVDDEQAKIPTERIFVRDLRGFDGVIGARMDAPRRARRLRLR